MGSPYELVELIVKAGGTVGTDCDYTDIKSALDAIHDNSAERRYVVRILNGVYDVSDDGNLFLGMKNYVDIVGQSRNGVQVVKRDAEYSDAKAVFDSAYYRQRIEYASLRNMTIVSRNLKCPVHIDDAFLAGTIEIVDCTLLNENTPDMGNYRNGLACGLRKGQRVVARGVYSNGMLWAHNDVGIYADEGCRFELYHCICKFIMIGDLITYGRDVAVVEGCQAEFLRYLYLKDFAKERLRPYVQSSFSIELRGNRIEYVEAVTTTDGGYTLVPNAFDELNEGKWSICDPSIHQLVKNTGKTAIGKGTLVTGDGAEPDMNGVIPWSEGSRLLGLALDAIEPGAFGIVQFGGTVPLPAHPGHDIRLDDAVELDASGRVARHRSGTAIGLARGVWAYDGNLLKIKLSLPI